MFESFFPFAEQDFNNHLRKRFNKFDFYNDIIIKDKFWTYASTFLKLELLENLIHHFPDKIDWVMISLYQPLPYDFIVKYREHILYDNLLRNCYISKEIREIFCL